VKKHLFYVIMSALLLAGCGEGGSGGTANAGGHDDATAIAFGVPEKSPSLGSVSVSEDVVYGPGTGKKGGSDTAPSNFN